MTTVELLKALEKTINDNAEYIEQLETENKRLKLNEQLAINNSKLFLKQLTEATEIIKFAIKGIKKIACEERCDFVNKEFFCDDCAYGKWIAKAEQFLNIEVENG